MSISLMCRVSLMKRCCCCCSRCRCHWLCCCLCLFLCHCDSQRVYDTHSESLPISGNLLLACFSLSSSSLLLNSPASQRQRALRCISKAARLIFNLIFSLISHLICKADTVRTRRAAAARRSTSAPSIIYINICLITGCLCHERFPQPPAPSGRRVLAVVAGYKTEKKRPKKAKEKCWQIPLKNSL